MRRVLFAATLAAAAASAAAQDKVNIGISGWTGFAPITLAAQAGIFKKNGVDATIKKIPQKAATSRSPRATSSAPPPR